MNMIKTLIFLFVAFGLASQVVACTGEKDSDSASAQ
jgi:ABC-type lipoprotein release transport system permease subunit